MEGKGGHIRGSFDKQWCVFKEFTHYKAIIDLYNIRVIRTGETEKQAFDKALEAMSKQSLGDTLVSHYLVIFDNQYNSYK